MCGHHWIRHEDVRECSKCGLTVTLDGKVLHDRRFPGAIKRKKYRKADKQRPADCTRRKKHGGF